jgi:hypothetical protein
MCTLSTTLGSGADEDEIERIRREFEDAKRNYLSIPAAMKDMPKMDPQGLPVRSSSVALECLKMVTEFAGAGVHGFQGFTSTRTSNWTTCKSTASTTTTRSRTTPTTCSA